MDRTRACSILLVSTNAQDLSHWEPALQNDGCAVVSASSFNVAHRLLNHLGPDLLVTNARLEAFSGFHLAILSAFRSPITKTIVVGDHDPSAEGEARAVGAHYLTRPVSRAELTGVVHRLTAGPAPRRRWPRLDAGGIAVHAETITGRLLDVSYGGLRMQVFPPDDHGFRATFDVALAGPYPPVVAQHVWHRQLADATEYGLCVDPEAAANATMWRGFVPSLRTGAHTL